MGFADVLQLYLNKTKCTAKGLSAASCSDEAICWRLWRIWPAYRCCTDFQKYSDSDQCRKMGDCIKEQCTSHSFCHQTSKNDSCFWRLLQIGCRIINGFYYIILPDKMPIKYGGQWYDRTCLFAAKEYVMWLYTSYFFAFFIIA